MTSNMRNSQKPINVPGLLLSIFQTIIICTLFCFIINPTFAQSENTSQNIPNVSSVESFLDSIKIDLPEATVSCTATGRLTHFFSKTGPFKSAGNTFFVDKNTKEIANFQRAIINSPDKQLLIQAFMKVNNVERKNLTDLLLLKKVVVSNNATVLLVIKEISNQEESTYILNNKDKNGNPINSTIFTQIKRLGNINFNGQKFITGDGILKIHFSHTPLKVSRTGELEEAFQNESSTLTCKCKKCPIHDFDLIDLEEAFDGGLVNDILNEASTPQ